MMRTIDGSSALVLTTDVETAVVQTTFSIETAVDGDSESDTEFLHKKLNNKKAGSRDRHLSVDLLSNELLQRRRRQYSQVELKADHQKFLPYLLLAFILTIVGIYYLAKMEE